MIELRLTRTLLNTMLADLRRPHPFAGERIGFVFGALGTLPSDGTLVLLSHYTPIDDDHYEEQFGVGAYIGQSAMAKAMNDVYQLKEQRKGIFHVHLHDWPGPTNMSCVDEEGIPPMIPGFANISKDAAHGILILSEDHASAWCRLPGSKALDQVARVTVAGAPVAIFDRGRAW